MEKLNIRYEMTFTCDAWLIRCIDSEWEYALEDVEGTETEEEIFVIALGYALTGNYDVGYNECEAIMAHSHEIYEWWKENKENV